MSFPHDEQTRVRPGDPTVKVDDERYSLAAMLVDADIIGDAKHKYGLEPSFYRISRHAMLFATLCDMWENGLPTFGSYVRDELITRYGLAFDEANALSLLNTEEGGQAGVLGLRNIHAHLEAIRKAATLRKVQDALQEVAQRVQDGDHDPNEIGAIAIETIRQHLPAVEAGDDGDEDQPFDAELGPEPTAALGWVAAYADQVSELTASPRSFNILIALVLAAAATQGRAKAAPFNVTIRANLFGANVGASSVYHKTTAQNVGQDVSRRAGLEKLLLPDSGTSEGLVAALAEQPAGLIVKDEIARLFAADRVRYTATMKQDLTDLFDGRTIRRRLSGADIVVNKPFVSILGSTTPTRFFDAIGPADWDDGFLVRWIFALPDREPVFDLGAFFSEAEIDRRLNALAQPLRQIAAQPETTFIFEGDAWQMWAAWHTERKRRAFDFGDDTANAITSRITTVAIKLALILAAANGEWGRITPQRMSGAIWLADMYRSNLWRLLNERSEHTVSGHKLAKVLQVANRHGAAGCTKRQLMRGAHLKSHELRPVLEKLLSLGAMIPTDDAKRYRAMHDKLPVKNYA